MFLKLVLLHSIGFYAMRGQLEKPLPSILYLEKWKPSQRPLIQIDAMSYHLHESKTM